MMGLTNPEVGILMLGLLIFVILLGFPIAFTLIAMAVGFGYYAIGPAIFNLLVQRTYGVMSNQVLIAVPLFLFMGYMVERSNILDRLFGSLQLATRHVPGSLAVASLITCALFATATGIVGAVVTLMGLLALPAMLKAGYDKKLASGRDLRRRLPRHPDPAVDHADPLRRHLGRVGGAPLRRRAVPRADARGALHPADHRAGLVEPRACAEAAGGGGARSDRTGDARSDDLVPAAGGSDPRGAGCDPVRDRHAPRGGGDGGAGRDPARDRLPGDDLPAAEGVGVPHREVDGDGVLALRRVPGRSRRCSRCSAGTA
jgi:hypothetical protein